MSEKDGSWKFYYNYIQYENVKKFDHVSTLTKYDQTYFAIKLLFFHDFSKKFQLVALTETEQHCSEITYLLFTEKLLLVITIYIIWDVSVSVIIILKDCMLFNNLILFSKRKKNHFLFVCSCILVNPLWNALMNNCLVIFLERN